MCEDCAWCVERDCAVIVGVHSPHWLSVRVTCYRRVFGRVSVTCYSDVCVQHDTWRDAPWLFIVQLKIKWERRSFVCLYLGIKCNLPQYCTGFVVIVRTRFGQIIPGLRAHLVSESMEEELRWITGSGSHLRVACLSLCLDRGLCSCFTIVHLYRGLIARRI
jgi:hypothetical protein